MVKKNKNTDWKSSIDDAINVTLAENPNIIN
jgi:hypothetical protein